MSVPSAFPRVYRVVLEESIEYIFSVYIRAIELSRVKFPAQFSIVCSYVPALGFLVTARLINALIKRRNKHLVHLAQLAADRLPFYYGLDHLP